MKIFRKLVIGAIITSLLSGLVSYVGIITIKSINKSFNEVAYETLPVIGALDDVRFASLRIIASTNEIGFIHAEKKSMGADSRADERREEHNQEELINSGIALHQKTLVTYERLVNEFFPAERERLKRIKETGAGLHLVSRQLIELLKEGKSGAEVLELREQLEAHETNHLQAIEAAREDEGREFAERKEKVEHSLTTAAHLFILASVFAFIITILASTYIIRHILNPINKLRDAASDIGKGNFDTKIDFTSQGEIGQLVVSFNRMVDDLRVSRDRFVTTARSLHRSTAEMQEFLKIASHDLQEPLRKVRSLSDLITTKYKESLGSTGCDYIVRMQKATEQLQSHIYGLRVFSAIGTGKKSCVQIDLDRLAQDVLADLSVHIEDSGGRVEVEKLPVMDGDSLQMRQLLQNLICNSLKFHKKGEPPVVKVSGKYASADKNTSDINDSDESYVELSIEDNGIGFDEKYTDRIFRVFQRLHNGDEYEGTGIGLSICRKIAERHEGSIRATSKPGQGSTFIVSIPVNQSGEGDQECAQVTT